jgi:glycosyltransferase involved in cell wall biosynthesis
MLSGQALHDALSTDSVAVWLFDDTPINRARSPAKLLALLAHGRPVVAEAVGEVPRLANRSATLIAPGDTAGLVESAVSLLRDPRARSALGGRARLATQTQATWTERAEWLERAYQAICT